jgi:outer membrane receptor protein involved in Fe transport
VGSSWRRGVETDVTLLPRPWIELGLAVTAMRGQIAEFTDDEAAVTYHEVEPLLTPRFTSAQRLVLRPSSALAIGAQGILTSRSQLDNTGNSALTLPGYFIGNLSAEWTRNAYALSLHLNNVTNTDRFAGGHVSFGEARYYVLPPRSAFLLAKVRL